jgi:hypothetical protein
MLRAGRRKGWPEASEKPALFPGRLDEAARWRDLTGTQRAEKPWLDGLPRLIFVVDMGDGFTASVDPDAWLTPKLGVIAATRRGRGGGPVGSERPSDAVGGGAEQCENGTVYLSVGRDAFRPGHDRESGRWAIQSPLGH